MAITARGAAKKKAARLLDAAGLLRIVLKSKPAGEPGIPLT
jgi:hypothetical protein